MINKCASYVIASAAKQSEIVRFEIATAICDGLAMTGRAQKLS
jgi:hypothetical protein